MRKYKKTSSNEENNYNKLSQITIQNFLSNYHVYIFVEVNFQRVQNYKQKIPV